MRDMHMVWNHLLNGAGVVVIGMAVMLFALCLIVSLATEFKTARHEPRSLIASETRHESDIRDYSHRIIVC